MKKNPDNGGVARVVPRLSSMGPGGPLRCANVGVLRRATRANPATSVVFLMTLPPVVASESVTGVSSGHARRGERHAHPVDDPPPTEPPEVPPSLGSSG